MRFLPCPFALVASPAFAAAAPAPAEVDAGGLVRVCLSLAVVIALILGAGWVLRRLQGGGVRAGGNLRCIESVAVGMKERVVLVEAGGTQMLLGVALCYLMAIGTVIQVRTASTRRTSIAPEVA